MSRRSTFCILWLLTFAGASSADIVWKVADEGPRTTSIVTDIVGDDVRTIAFTAAGTAEFDGNSWHPVSLNTDSVLPKYRQMFAAGGHIVAVATDSATLRLFFLRGNEWSLAASLPFSYHPFGWQRDPFVVRGDDRIYVPDAAFDHCGTGPCPEAARRLRSISLVDGSIRDEPELPDCPGLLFTVADHLFLFQYQRGCAETSMRNGPGPGILAAGTPFYRLDGDHWTTLEPWTLPLPFAFTQNAAWIATSWTGTAGIAEFALFTSTGLSEPISWTHEANVDVRAMEVGGKPLLVETRTATIYEVRGRAFVPLLPAPPMASPAVFAAGSQLFTTKEGWGIHLLEPSGWTETPGVPENAGGQTYMAGRTKTFASRGDWVFQRDPDGWTRLPSRPPPDGRLATVIGDDPVVVRGISPYICDSVFAFRHDRNEWVDLQVPNGSCESPLGAGDDLYVRSPTGSVYRLRAGAWTILTGNAGSYGKLVEVNGSVYVLSCQQGARWGVCRIDGDTLVPAFPDLDPMSYVMDMVAWKDEFLLWTQTSIPWNTVPFPEPAERPVLTAASAAGYRIIASEQDSQFPVYSYPGNSFAVVDGTPVLGGSALVGGELRTRRGQLLPGVIDRSGRFAYGVAGSYDTSFRGPLLVPGRRVRKDIAAAVDTTGFGGARYRSSLTIANFSPGTAATARIVPGAAVESVMEVPLGPGSQKTIEDPVPGFVGPLTVEFDGLSDEEDAWAAVRVWSPSDGGSASTSLVGTDPGRFPLQTYLAPPIVKAGSRTHVAFAASGDGPGSALTAGACQPPPYMYPCWVGGRVENRSFLQFDLPAEALGTPITALYGCGCPSGRADDDLLGYLVRNEAGTNDGTVVPFEPPTLAIGRQRRFLPAVVSGKSPFGRYRTELVVGWASSIGYPPLERAFDVTIRSNLGSVVVPLTIRKDGLFTQEDAGAWVAALSWIGPSRPTEVDGTMLFTSDRPEGAAELLVTSVVTARGPGASGDYGVSVPVFDEAQWASTEAIVPGLREDASFRSNLAVASPEPDGGPPVTLSVSLRRASDGAQIGTFPPISLAPGQRFQLNRPLSEVGYGGDAYAVISRTAGTGRFVAYGVMNDNVTGDGTLFPMTRAR